MAASWADEQMHVYGSHAQQAADEGMHHADEEMKLLIMLVNKFADVRKLLNRAFWNSVEEADLMPLAPSRDTEDPGVSTVVVRRAGENRELVLSYVTRQDRDL